MPMTLLEIVQEFSDRTGSLDRPTAVMSTQDDTVRQIRALANEVLSDITSRGESWAMLQKQATFVTVATELQGTILALAPYGFKNLVLGSAFNRTTRQPLFGPRNAQAWQESQALPQTGPFSSYRIWQGNFYLQPSPTAGQSIYFEYASDMAIIGVASATDFKKRFTADTDQFLLDDDLLLMGLRWKFRREQGLTYAQEKQDFEAMLTNYTAAQPTKGPLSLSGGHGGLRPGIFVPSGNWAV